MMLRGEIMQVVGAVAAGLGQGACGHIFPMSAFALPQLMSGEDGQITLSSHQGSLFASTFAIGSITGALLGGYQSDKIGRRLSMILDCCMYVTAFLLQFSAPNYELLMLGRWLAGHSAGSNLVSAPIFISETSHPNIRGTTGNFIMVFYTFGFSSSMFLGAALSWRYVCLFLNITPALSLLLLLFLKETPTWLVNHGKEEEAFKSLLFYRGDPEVARSELKRIQTNIKETQKNSDLPEVSWWEKWKQKTKRMKEKSFFKPFLTLNLMLNIGLEWAGFPALAFYTHTVLRKVHVPMDPYWTAAFISLYRMIVTISLSFILMKVPRRSMYLGSGCLVALALIIQGTYAMFGSFIPPHIASYTSYLPLAAIILQYTGFGLGYGPIVFILQGELLPSDMRSFGSCALGVIDNVFLFASVESAPYIMDSFGIGQTFLLYASICIGNLILCYFLIPETKGLSLEDIEDHYNGKMKEPEITITDSTQKISQANK